MASHLEPPYRSLSVSLPHTEFAAAETLQLPMHAGMSEHDADQVVAAINDIYRHA
jgi:dTDP-4-amino-4,6-dideoxygalactose transaminase